MDDAQVDAAIRQTLGIIRAQIWYPTDKERAIYRAGLAAGRVAGLEVWFGPMPESNGKSNWTAILHRGELHEGYTIARSERKDQVRYHADCVRWLIGELKERPDILAYDPELTESVHADRIEGSKP